MLEVLHSQGYPVVQIEQRQGIDKQMTCSAGFECLTEDLEEVMGLFNELIQEPALPQEKLLLYKNQVRAQLSTMHPHSS